MRELLDGGASVNLQDNVRIMETIYSDPWNYIIITSYTTISYIITNLRITNQFMYSNIVVVLSYIWRVYFMVEYFL